MGIPDCMIALYFLFPIFKLAEERNHRLRHAVGRKRGVDVHIAHRNHVVDFRDTQPVQDIGHERLEAHILHTRDELRRLEVLVGRVAAAFTEVVHEVSVRGIAKRKSLSARGHTEKKGGRGSESRVVSEVIILTL